MHETTKPTHIALKADKKEAYKTSLEIILALCKKASYKSSEIETIQLICETTLKGEI